MATADKATCDRFWEIVFRLEEEAHDAREAYLVQRTGLTASVAGWPVTVPPSAADYEAAHSTCDAACEAAPAIAEAIVCAAGDFR